MVEDDLQMRILGVDPEDEIAGARKLSLRTSRGPISIIMHAAENSSRAILCVCGAIGGFDGPAMLYPRLGLIMPHTGTAVARMNYRQPNEFGECVLDTLAALTFLKGMGHDRIALIGHSFGGAVVINAGTLSPVVTTVVAVSSQLAGAHVVGELTPKPLLLIHGTADTILSDECSRMLYQRAGEPKTLKLFDGADHRLSSRGDELFTLVQGWIESRT
ncbi:MAG: dienelactone hydrolase family protein [Deltaproteobacteria bacterium]|nr:dienelactone hydrolase family protein [Deltaproteobacteria bacterium]